MIKRKNKSNGQKLGHFVLCPTRCAHFDQEGKAAPFVTKQGALKQERHIVIVTAYES